jgi:hypothetical protein
MPRPAGLPRLGRGVPEIWHRRTDRTADLRQRDNVTTCCRDCAACPRSHSPGGDLRAARVQPAGPRGGAPGPRSSLAPHPLGLAAAAAAETWLSWACPLAGPRSGQTRSRRAAYRSVLARARPGGARVADSSLISWQRRRPDHLPDAPRPATTLRAGSLSPPRVLSSSTPCQARSRPSLVIPRCLRDVSRWPTASLDRSTATSTAVRARERAGDDRAAILG